MDGMGLNSTFWKDKRVFLTGHTGFKGAWMTIMLHRLGAKVFGYSLDPPTDPSLFNVANLADLMTADHRNDITDLATMTKALQDSQADIVFHLAAQPLVSEGYADPVGTYASNVMGTVNIMEAIRHTPSVVAAVLITTDKCYENVEWIHPYREPDRLGGVDPYSNSKACSELVIAAYQKSFFAPHEDAALIASTRAGNVVGGGDWAKNRLITDCIGSFSKGDPVVLRSPHSIRPWQHVLEPLTGYMLLAEGLLSENGKALVGGWNFGPDNAGEATVSEITSLVAENWGADAKVELLNAEKPFYESKILRLDSTKAKTMLGWHPQWNSRKMIEETVAWYKRANAQEDMLKFTSFQIDQYLDGLK